MRLFQVIKNSLPNAFKRSFSRNFFQEYEKDGKIKGEKDREGLNQLRWVEENIRNVIACPLFILGGLIKYWTI